MKNEKISLSSYIDTLQSRGQYHFVREQAIKETQLSEDTFRKAAYRLAKKKRVKRIYRDFFIIVPVEYRHPGALPATWFIDPLMQHLQVEYYVSLLTAAGIYGAAHQQAMSFQVMSNKIMPTITIGNLNIEFYYREKIKSDCYKPIKTETGSMKVSTVEMTVCDCMRYMKAAGHIHNIATVLLELRDQINMDRLIQYIKEGYLEISSAQRLGYLIEALNLQLSTIELYDWLRSVNRQYCLLIPGNSKSYEHNRKWKVIINERVEPDEI